MTQRGKKRGLLLITVLFFAVLVMMFAHAALVLAPSSLARSAADSALTSADLAARSGIDWARGRISQDPQWNAQATKNFAMNGLIVHEGQGQVTGWVQQAAGWARFRMRFNYQDGPALSAANSDELDNPSSPWTDLTLVSCNNLMGGTSRTVPEARDGSSTTNSEPWTNTQLNLPAATLLLSVEGMGGPVSVGSDGEPTGFAGPTYHRIVQSLLKFGDNQPTTDAAISAAGPLSVRTYGPGPTELSAQAGQVARLRTKDDMHLGDVHSENGDLRHVNGLTNGTITGSVTEHADTDGFYKIPSNKVRQPTGSLTLAAGTYVVTAAGKLMHYNMNYRDYVLAASPTGTEVTTLPTGMTLTGPNAAPPKFRVTLTADLKITASGTVHDFALIPDGGAPQSEGYGGVPPATASPQPAAAASPQGVLTTQDLDAYARMLTYGDPLTFSVGNSPLQSAAWTTFIQDYGVSPVPDVMSGNVTFALPGGGFGAINPAGPVDLINVSYTDLYNSLLSAFGSTQGKLAIMDLMASSGVPAGGASPPPGGTGSPPPSGSPSTPALTPADVELDLQGGSSGLVVSNADGNLIIGTQILGNGAALVSTANISLIGTSTDLSSTPGAALGLNLYAQGLIHIDPFRLDPRGVSSFRGIKLQGVVYSWLGTYILAGNSTVSAPFSLVGAMVAYGGNPANPPQPGTARAEIIANTASIEFDPSFVAGLLSKGPFTLRVIAWHEF